MSSHTCVAPSWHLHQDHLRSLSFAGSWDPRLHPCVCSAAGSAPEAPERRKHSNIYFHWFTRGNLEPWLLPTSRSFPPLVLRQICSWKTLAFQEVAWTSVPLLLFPRTEGIPQVGRGSVPRGAAHETGTPESRAQRAATAISSTFLRQETRRNQSPKLLWKSALALAQSLVLNGRNCI